MTWVKIDDRAMSHPKVLEVGREAFGVYVASLAYANSYESDGFLPEASLPTILADADRSAVTKLVRAGLWEEVEGGFQIHNFHKYQPLKADLEERRSRDSERKRAKSARNPSGIRSESARNPSGPPARARPRPDPVPDPCNDPPDGGSSVRSPDGDPDAAPSKPDPIAKKAAEVVQRARDEHGKPWRKPSTHLTARIREGATAEECLLVLAFKIAQWGGDEKMAQYVRQKTLYARDNFEGYLEAARRWEGEGKPGNPGQRKKAGDVIDLSAYDDLSGAGPPLIRHQVKGLYGGNF